MVTPCCLNVVHLKQVFSAKLTRVKKFLWTIRLPRTSQIACLCKISFIWSNIIQLDLHFIHYFFFQFTSFRIQWSTDHVLMWSILIQFDPIWSNMIQPTFDQFFFFKFTSFNIPWSTDSRFDEIHCDPIKSNLIQFDPIWSNMIQLDIPTLNPFFFFQFTSFSIPWSTDSRFRYVSRVRFRAYLGWPLQQHHCNPVSQNAT